MNRSFSPRHNFTRSPMGFQNRFRMQSNQQQFNQGGQQGMQFCSPQSASHFHQRVSYPSPDIRQRIVYDSYSPNHGHFTSPPQYHSSPRMFSPRNQSPYYNERNSFNNSWNYHSSYSADSSSNSSAYFADLSGSPYSGQSKEYRFKKRKFPRKDANPGHSDNIEDYLHPSMLEDPWEKDVAKYEKKQSLSTPKKDENNS